MRTAVELLGRPNVADETKQRAREILARQVAQMTGLIDDLSEFARLTAGIELCLQRVVLQDIVRRAVDFLRPAMAEKQLKLSIDVPPDALLVDADAPRLEQAISRLLSDAARRSQKGARVWLRAARTSQDRVTLAVRTEGMGVADENLCRLFQMPATVGASPATHAGGSVERGLGIGLSLAQQLVTLHGGTFGWRSDPDDEGNEAAIHLPLPAIADQPAPQ